MAPKNGHKASKPVIERVDALGDGGRANLAARMIGNLQAEAFNLEMTRVANNHHASDPAPGVTGPDGQPITYDERKAQVLEAEERLLEAYSDLRPAIEAAIAGQP